MQSCSFVSYMCTVASVLCVSLTAERRAQLSRSRSRQNILSPEENPTAALVREINFTAELDTTPVLQRHDGRHKTHTQKVSGSNTVHSSRQQNGGLGKISTRSEAEQLLERLRAL